MKRDVHLLLRSTCLAAGFLLLLTAAKPARAQVVSLSAKQILDKVDDLYRGKSSYGKMDMIITTAHWKRTLSMEFWNKGKDKSLFRILAPKKEKGTATLRSGNDIWNYLPKIKRVIKLPSSMLSASWMGSHFTNDDLVKESRMADDYTFELTFEGDREGQEVVEITCHPKPEAPVVWGKVVVTAKRRGYLPVNVKYYDEDFKLTRIMSFSEISNLKGRTLPTVLTIVPEDKPLESTIVKYNTIEFDLDLGDQIFSLRNLQR